MHAGFDRPEFAPPPQPGLLRAFALAVLAHLLLVLMLTQGLRWQRETQDAAVEAELWSSVPVEAAPKPEPTPPAPPAPPPEPPKPVVQAPPQPDPQALRDAQIALEREKAKREEEKRKQADLEREREERRKAAEAKKKHEAELAKKKHEEELARRKLEQQKIAEAKRKEAEEKKRKQQEREEREAKLREQIRKDSMSRMQEMVGTGGPDSTGTAARSAGPSRSWAGRVIARVRPNIVYTELLTGNPEAVVEVRMAPDGTIVGKRLKKSSGSKSWDDAVLRALDKTEVLPRDPETGRVPSSAELVFRPKD
jgi:colicin import membrane protein